MKHFIQAACGCHIGKIRKKNEDNFCFEGKYLEKGEKSLECPVFVQMPLNRGLSFAVFDGMGGESFGEYASLAAASQMAQSGAISPKIKKIKELVFELNSAVELQKKNLLVSRMGTTMAGLYFASRYLICCNVGDSRIYRLRNGSFEQMSIDHSSQISVNAEAKAPLVQYLGINSQELLLEPFIEKHPIKSEDIYLLCSDGLTDMVSEKEIQSVLENNLSVVACVEKLTELALEHGGRDNITIIICKIG